MERTAIQITFPKEPTGTNDRIFDEIQRLLRERGVDGDEITIEFKEYEDTYGGPVIYFP